MGRADHPMLGDDLASRRVHAPGDAVVRRGLLGQQRQIGLDVVVDSQDAVEHGLRQLDGRDTAAGQFIKRLLDGQLVEAHGAPAALVQYCRDAKAAVLGIRGVYQNILAG